MGGDSKAQANTASSTESQSSAAPHEKPQHLPLSASLTSTAAWNQEGKAISVPGALLAASEVCC